MAHRSKRTRLNADDTFLLNAKLQTFEASGEGLRHIIIGLVALALMRLRIPALGGLLVFVTTRYGPDLAALGSQLLK